MDNIIITCLMCEFNMEFSIAEHKYSETCKCKLTYFLINRIINNNKLLGIHVYHLNNLDRVFLTFPSEIKFIFVE